MDSLYEAVQEWYNSARIWAFPRINFQTLAIEHDRTVKVAGCIQAVFVSASQSGPLLPPRHRDLSLIDGFHRHAAPHIEKLWGGQKVTICPAETQHFGQGLRLGSLKLAIYSSNLMQSTGILRPKIWPDEFTHMWIYPRSKPDGTSENAWRSKKELSSSLKHRKVPPFLFPWSFEDGSLTSRVGSGSVLNRSPAKYFFNLRDGFDCIILHTRNGVIKHG